MGVFCVNTTSKEFKDTSKRLNIHSSSLEVCVHLFLNSSFAKEQLDTTGLLPFPSDNYIREFFSLGNAQSGREAIDDWVEEYGATDGRVTDKQFIEASQEYPREALHSYLDAQGNKVNIVSRPTINTLKDLKYFLQKLNIIDDSGNLLGITVDRFYERMNALAIPASLYMHFDKELKKQISLLFKLNPELAEVGTEEQYLQYLANLNENGNLNLRNFITRDTQSSLFNSDGTINWETFESLTNDYYDRQADSMFSHGRYTLATRPENHFTGEKNTLNHIKFVTQSMLDLLEGKFDKDLPFVSEARASLRNQRDLMVLAAMFHDAAKPYRHGDIHGWESADILRDIIGLNYNNRVAEWAVRHHMPMPFAHKAEFSLSNPDALEVAKNIARDARRVGIDAATAINAFVLINAADIINGRELNVDDNWAKKAMAEGPTKYGSDISVRNVLSIELKEKVDLLKQAFKEIENEDFGNPVFNYTNQQRFDYTEFPEGGRKDGKLPYLSNTTNVLLPGSTEDVNQFAEFVGNKFISPYTQEMQDIKAKAIAEGTFMKAPNGKNTNLTERQWLQVRTKNFINWFGDWINDPRNASKIVDENGEPMVMVHGSPESFNIFRLGSPIGTNGRGMYFGKAPKNSEEWTYGGGNGYKYLCFLNIRNLYNAMEIFEKDDTGKILPKAIMNEIIGANSYEQYLEDITKYPTEFERLQEQMRNVSKKTYQRLHAKYDGKGLFAADKNVVKHIFRKNETYLTLNPKFVGEIVVRDPNQIKSATDNNGMFSTENDNILFQKQPITVQTRKLWTVNLALLDIGSETAIRRLLNSKEIDPVITNAIIDAINKEPKLKELKPLEVFNIVRRAEETGLAKDYNDYIQQPVIDELEKLLLDYLKPLHVEAIEDEVAEKYGVTGLYDILNKVIHLAKNRNSITVTEEFAHAFIELMGARVSGKPENADYTFLYNTIEGTSIYKQVYELYKDTYTIKDSKGETVPDIKKIKKEAIGQALAVAINNKWNEEHLEEEKGFWEKLKEWFNSILDFFSNLNNAANKFLGTVDEDGYIDINELLDKIATEVLHKDYSRLNKVDSKKYNLLDYTETIANQTKKDGGLAVDFMKWYSSIGNIITGSLAYRKQGTVYRPQIESLHDIDMVVPASVHGVDLLSPIMQAALKNKGTQPDTIPFLLKTEYFQKVLEKYPDLQITAAYTDNKGGLIVNSLWSKNKELINKFEGLSGTYADRLVHFTQEERDLMYLFDFFLEPTDSAESFIEETTGITLSKYPRIFKSKLALGRAKDIFDYQMWDLFEEFKADNLSEEEYLMFQKPIQYNPEQQEAIRQVGEFIADRTAKEDFFLISGKAGTGKTTIINEIVNNEANRLGRLPSVFITAIANKAVLNLDAKIEAPHVKKATASALGFYESVKSNGEKTWKKPKNWKLEELPISKADILFIDECSMLDTAKLDMILQIKRLLPDLKIVMIGDRGQIHSIEDKDSDNTLVSDEDKEGFAPSVVFTYKNKKEAALLTRVRLGEESPVLGFADKFWEAATSGKKELPSEAKEKTIITANGAVIRYKDTSATVNEDIAKNLLPLFEKAREDGNPNHVKIVAVHKEQVQRYNDLIYSMMHPDETSPYNPLHAGDMIMFYAPYGEDEDELGNQVSKYYNSSELVVQKVKTAPYKADLSNIIDMLHKFAPNIDTTPYESIMVQDIEVEYNGHPDTITVICPSLDNTETLIQLGTKLGRLANEFYRDGKINLGGMFLGLRTSLELKIADVRLNYAISAHKSQGSTYDIVIVDSKDIRGGRVKGERYNNGNPRATWGGFTGPGERAAIMYTAITRASNVTVVLHGTTGDAASLDIESINEAITLNKQGNSVVMPLAIQPKKQQPETKSEQSSQSEDDEWNKVQEDWNAIFDEHNDHIEFIDTADKHEYWYYPNGKDDSENKQKMDITVTGLTNPVQGRNAWLDVSGNIGTSADRVVRDFFMGIDVLDKKYPNFTKEQLRTLVDNLNNFKKFLDKEFAGTKYKIVTNPFSLVGKVTKYNGTTQTVGGTVDILIYDEEGGYMIYDIKTTRKDDLKGTDTLKHYESQVNLYRELLEAMHPLLKGKCIGLGILLLHTFYSTPQGLRALGETGTTVYSINKATNQILADGISLEKHEGYDAPHFPDNNVLKAVIPFESFATPKQYYLTGSPKPLAVSSLNSKPAKEINQVQAPVSVGSAVDNVKKATTRKVKDKDVTFSANMYEQYEDNARDDISSETTLDAIVNGERTATTRWSHIEGFYDQIKEGDIVEFHDKNGRSILVRITKAPHKLTLKDDAEEWSKKEGWSIEYYNNEVKPHVRAEEAYQMEYEYVEGSFVDENNPSRSRINTITISQEKDKHNYKKGYPQKHTDTAFIFTENALANAANLGIAPVGPRPSKITLDVNAQGRSGKFNQADIRTDEDGNRTENAFGLVDKKYQQSKEGQWVKQEGCFEDTETDFLIFMKANLQMFARLEDSEYDKMVFPFEVALGKAALPKRFANWLKNQLEARYGIITTIEKNTTPGYKGYGLRVQEIVEGKKAPEIKGENISSKGSEFAKKLTNYGNTVSIEFKGKTYRNAEHAYQTWKSGEFDEDAYNSTAAKPKGSKTVNKEVSDSIMVDILTAKLQQHPELVKGITDRGGVAYLKASTHDVIGDLHWETKNGKGDNGFINALIKAYQQVSKKEVLFDADENPLGDNPELNSHFTLSSGDYAQRTDENAEWADVTLALAEDFTTAGEIRTAKAAGATVENRVITDKGDSYVSETLNPKVSLDNAAEGIAVSILEQLDDSGKTDNIKLNIAGNGMYSLEDSYTLEEINELLYKILRKVLSNGVTISEIRSGGLTGIDEAGIIAAQRLGIKWSVNAPSGWKFRVSEDTFESEYEERVPEGSFKKNRDGSYDISDEKLFKERFGQNAEEGSNQSQEDYDEQQDAELEDKIATASALPISQPINPEDEFSKRELALIEQTRNLVELSSDVDTLFKPSELKSWAKACMFLVSDMVSILNSSETRKDEFFRYLDNEALRELYMQIDFTKMDRIEILSKLGDNAFRIIKEKYFNAVNNPNSDNFKKKTLKKLQAINSNFDAFIQMGRATLAKIENVSDTGNVRRILVDDSEDVVEGLDAETLAEIAGSSIEAWLVNFRGLSAHSSLSLMVKRAIETCYDYDENGNKKINEIGIPERVNSALAVNNILMWTQGAETLGQMVEILKEKQEQHPWLSLLIAKLDENSQDETFKSQFYSNFKKYFQPYIIQYVKETKDPTGRVISTQLMNKVINLNALEKLLLEQYRAAWQNRSEDKINLSNLDGTMDSSSVDIIANAVNTLRDFLDELDEDEENVSIPKNIMQTISDIYWVFDIELDSQLMDKLNNVDTIRNIYKNLVYLSKNLNRNKEKTDYDVVKNNEKNLQALFSYIVDSSQTTLESVAYEDGKLHYSYVTPSYLSKLIEKLKGNTEDYEAFMEKEYGQFPWFKDADGEWRNEWLRLLNENEETKENLQHAVVLTSQGVGYRDKSPLLYAKSMLLNYFYGGANSLWAFYRVPMLSNKPSEEYIRFRRYIDSDYQEEISRLLMNVAYQEIDRILTCRQRQNSDVAHIKSFDKNGQKFMFLDYLQEYLNEYLKWRESHPRREVDKTNGALLLGKMLNDRIEGVLNLDREQFEDLLQKYIIENMNERFRDYMRYLKAEGVLELDEDGNYIHLADLKIDGTNGRSTEENLLNFFWNDTFAAINILQLTVTDIAYYKDAEDLQKRLAQIHAPGLRANLDATWKGVKVVDAKKKTRTIYINDFDNVVSDAIANIEQIFENKARHASNSQLAKEIREQAEHILSAFKLINVTDAQGYSSPSSYRKKAIIFGKWSDELEEVYQKIRGGRYNTRDLEVMMQPLKPFVYSNTTKDSVGRLNKLKVGMQNKNSEYLLLMMDAILLGEENSGNPRKSKLAAIYKVMEDSHYEADGVTYKPDGIDTVQFNSTVKAGEMGVIDINSATTTQEAIDILENAIYVNGETVNGYNPDTVHELDFEDYCIQNEVPAHLEGTSIFGSQMRILSISDMPEIVNNEEQFITFRGLRTSLRQLKQNYVNACAANIYQSLEELRKQFKLEGTRAQKNIALSRILQEQIDNDARFGFDLKYAVMTDEQGNFNIPISDPIQAGRIQQLLNSVIKTRINKQQIEGGPVVQVTNFGTSSELNIIFKDANGNALQTLREFYDENTREYSYEEFLNMAHYENSKEASERKLYNEYYRPIIDEYNRKIGSKQAGIMYFECYAPSTVFQEFADDDGVIHIEDIPEEMLEIIGFRIPTEFKYSMAPLKIVGLLPSEAGEGIMLPKEITTLSGSDFDIDKLYIIRPVVQLDMWKVRKEYRKLLNKTYDTKAIWDDIYLNFPEIDEQIELIQHLTYEQYKQDQNLPDLEFEEFLEIAKTTYGKKRKLDWIPNASEVFEKITKQWDDMDDYVIDHGIQMSFKEFKEQARKQAKYYTKVTDMNTKRGRDNLIFDSIWSILTSELAMDQIFTPGNFDMPKKYGYMAAVLEMYDKKSLINYLSAGKSDEEKKAIQEKYKDTSLYDIVDSLSTDELKAAISKNKNLVYNHVHLQFHKQNMVAGKLIGIFAQNNVSHGVISLIDQTAKLDSQGNPQKDSNGKIQAWKPTIDLPDDLIIINKKTIGGPTPYDTLQDLEGNRISNTLAAFLAASVDAVKDPVLNYMNVNQVTAGILTSLVRMGYNIELAMLLLTQPIVKEFVQEFNIANEGDNYKSFNTLINEKIAKIVEENSDANINEDIIPEISRKGLIATLKNRTAESDVNLLKALQALNQVSDVNSAIISITKFNSVTSALGPMLSNTILLRNRIENNLALEALQTESMQKALANPIITAFREATFTASDEIFSGLMLQGSKQFVDLVNRVEGMIRGRMTDKEVNKLADFYMAFMLTRKNPVFKTDSNKKVHTKERRKEILEKLPNRVKQAKKNTNNKLLKRLEIRAANDSHSNRWLFLNTRGMSGDISDEIGAAWLELYLENPKLAMDLIEYNFYVAGLGFNPNTFSNLIPVALRVLTPNYVELLNPSNSLNSIELDRLIDQFFRNNYGNRKLVPDINKVKGITWKNESIMIDADIDAIQVGENKAPYVMYRSRIFKFEKDFGNKVKYTLVSELGGKKNEILEVNAKTDIESIFDDEFYHPKKEEKKEKGEKPKVEVEGKSNSKADKTRKPTANTFISQIQYFILNQVDERFRDDRINRLWKSVYASKENQWAPINALKSLFNDTLGKGVYDKEVFGQMKDVAYIIQAALKGIKDDKVNMKSLEKLVNSIKDTENDLNICG